MGLSVAVDPDEILRLHDEGASAVAIASRLFVSERTVHRWLRRLRPDRERAGFGAPIPPAKRQRALELAAERLPSAWIAEEVGLHENTVNNLRRRMDLPSDPEWKGIAMSIRKTPALARLHEEFQPK